MKRTYLMLCLFALVSISTLGQETTAPAPALDPVRVEGTTFTYKVALRQGLFKKYGLDIQSGAGAKDDMAGRLAKGDLDIEDGGLENGVAATLTGVDAVMITGADEQVQELIAQPEIKSIEDLRGKTIVVDTTSQQAALIIKKMLLLHGLKYDIDYKFKIVGAKRLPAMEASKDNAAAILAGTLVGLAESKGFVSLGKSSETCGPLLYHGAFVRRDWGKAHADLLARYIAAEIEAQRWILSPSNKQKVEDMLMKSSDTGTTPEMVETTYADMMSGPGAMTPDLRFDVPAFKNFLKLRAETEGSWGGTPPPAKSLYDLSYYKKALTLVPKT
jgi:ABC-type nitrate/sulfonate/bicarbonate transport system substrate-binding protein